MKLRVEAYPGRAGRKERALADRRMERIVELLVSECRVPRERITTVTGKVRQPPAVRISVMPAQPGKGN